MTAPPCAAASPAAAGLVCSVVLPPAPAAAADVTSSVGALFASGFEVPEHRARECAAGKVSSCVSGRFVCLSFA